MCEYSENRKFTDKEIETLIGWPPMTDTTTNQKCSGDGEKRMEKRDAREREQDANAPCLRARRERGGNVAHHR